MAQSPLTMKDKKTIAIVLLAAITAAVGILSFVSNRDKKTEYSELKADRDFINNERIKLAVSLLHSPGRKIKDVYLECGFESRSYFNRVFKRIKKVSPGTYQRFSKSAAKFD